MHKESTEYNAQLQLKMVTLLTGIGSMPIGIVVPMPIVVILPQVLLDIMDNNTKPIYMSMTTPIMVATIANLLPMYRV